MKLYCDMDGVLVHQVGRLRWDLMDWMPDGRELWRAIKQYRPTLLSQLMADVWEVSRHEKRIWVDREIGPDVPLIVAHGEHGKFFHSGPGHILIDDSEAHCPPWQRMGGDFILHRSARESIARLNELLAR